MSELPTLREIADHLGFPSKRQALRVLAREVQTLHAHIDALEDGRADGEAGIPLVREVWIGPNGHENFAFRTLHEGEQQTTMQHGRWYPEPVAARLIDQQRAERDNAQLAERLARARESLASARSSIDVGQPSVARAILSNALDGDA